MRSWVKPGFVIVLVLLAGCSGVPVGPGTDGGTGTAPTTTEQSSQTSTSQTTTPTTTPTPDPADLSASNITAEHQQALTSASEFQTTLNVSKTLGSTSGLQTGDVRMEVTADAELGAGQLAVVTTVASNQTRAVVRSYQTNSAVYHKRVNHGANTTRYFVVNKGEDAPSAIQPYKTETILRTKTIGAVVNAATFIERGTQTVDGVQTVEYAANGVDALESPKAIGVGVSKEKVRAFSATLLISEDGVVRKASYTITVLRNGEPVTYSTTVTVDAVGDVTVDEPSWIDEAISSSN